ncbi:GDSL esterase/lipase At3g48460-like [Rutidosis leptorrhynchoides]|uniref:GDSL esterase/lipase At3g48460-like n=1 Tax=Rutidosis leptorrhynchoides TaxID=125765 RepID=UPI003A9A2B72
MSSITLAFFLLFTISSASVSSRSSSSSSKAPRPFKKIYAFGDSYTDTGNTNTVSGTGPNGFTYVSNLPYGRTFFHHPTNRYSDGRLVIDFVTESLSLPYLPPYLNTKADTSAGINYAVAGSTAIRHAFFVKNNLTLNITPQSLQTQLAWFNKTLRGQKCQNANSTPNECTAVFKDALVWVGEIGANDYAYTLGSTVTHETIQRGAIRSVTGFIEALLKKGAKYMVVQGLPTTGCLTLAMYLSAESDRDDIGCVASANNQSYVHNTILQTNIQSLRKKYPKAIIVYADYWNAYHYIMKNAPKLGFHELYDVCCGLNGGAYNFDLLATCGSQNSSSCHDPSQYINWDGVHLTEAMYKLVSELFLKGRFTRPPFEYLLRSKRNSD